MVYNLLRVSSNLAANFTDGGWQWAGGLFPVWLQLVQKKKKREKTRQFEPLRSFDMQLKFHSCLFVETFHNFIIIIHSR